MNAKRTPELFMLLRPVRGHCMFVCSCISSPLCGTCLSLCMSKCTYITRLIYRANEMQWTWGIGSDCHHCPKRLFAFIYYRCLIYQGLQSFITIITAHTCEGIIFFVVCCLQGKYQNIIITIAKIQTKK